MRRTRWGSSVGLLSAVLCLTACLGTGETIEPLAFDPPSSFDLERAVPLTEDEAQDGTLHGTTLFVVIDGVLRATDLGDERQLWSTRLPTDTDQDYLRPPFVLGGTVIVATGELPKDVTPESNYTVNLFGFDASTGETRWEMSTPMYTLLAPRFGLQLSERDGELLVTMGFQTAPFATLLLDPGTGELRWKADVVLVASTDDRYAVATPENQFTASHAVALDLETGEVVAQLSETGSTCGQSYVDPHEGGSSITFSVVNEDSTVSFFRFSSTDATVQPFTPVEGDIRYAAGSSCSLEEGQTVALCQVGPSDLAYGVDAVSGQVLWAFDGSDGPTLEYAGQYHGSVYGLLGGEYVVVALATGEIINRNLEVSPATVTNSLTQSSSAKVNEYGAVGIPDDNAMRSQSLYVWAPASG